MARKKNVVGAESVKNEVVQLADTSGDMVLGISEPYDFFDPNNAKALFSTITGSPVVLQDTATFVAPKPLTPDQLPTLQRLKLLGNLGDFCDNAAVRSSIQALPSGELIWDILVSTISEKVELWMAGKAAVEPIAVPVGDAYQQAQALATALAQFRALVEHMGQSQVLGILSTLSEKLSGQRAPQVQASAPKPQRPLAADAAALINQMGP